jgi:hypothetical protein
METKTFVSKTPASKEDLFKEIEDCVRIMNGDTFWRNQSNRAKGNVKWRAGTKVIKEVLGMFRATTLCELNRNQLAKALDHIHHSVIRGQ